MSSSRKTKSVQTPYQGWSEEKQASYRRWLWPFLLRSGLKLTVEMGVITATVIWLIPLIETGWLRLAAIAALIFLGTIALRDSPDVREMGRAEFSVSFDRENDTS